MFGKKNPNEYSGDYDVKHTVYWLVKLNACCMSCNTVRTLTLNFQERYNMATWEYDLNYLPKTHEYIPLNCNICNIITVSEIQKVESIKSQKYNQDITFNDN